MPTLSTIAVGGPNLVSGEGWDVAPLVLAVMLVVLLWRLRIPLNAPVLLSALFGGVLLDLGIETLGISLATAVAVIALSLTIVALGSVRPERPSRSV